MSFKPIHPTNDPRVTHEFATVNGRKYHYVQGIPEGGEPKATILCVHGFPDLWFSWRNTIPQLLALGLRVIVPDQLGYGQTDAPRVPPEDISIYSWKSAADNMAELLRILNIPKVILLGHDWGGAIVYRIYHWYPEVVTAIACFATPYTPLKRHYIPLEKIVELIPSFTYQLALLDPQTEKDLESRDAISRFFRALHRGVKDRSMGKLQVTKNLMDALGDQPRSSLMSEEELEFYVNEYSRNGMHGPLQYYRLTRANYEEEKDHKLGQAESVDVPVLWVAATHDVALPPTMGAKQGEYIKDLTTRQIDCSHWVMAEAPEESNAILKEWLEKVCFGGAKTLSPAQTANTSKL